MLKNTLDLLRDRLPSPLCQSVKARHDKHSCQVCGECEQGRWMESSRSVPSPEQSFPADRANESKTTAETQQESTEPNSYDIPEGMFKDPKPVSDTRLIHWLGQAECPWTCVFDELPLEVKANIEQWSALRPTHVVSVKSPKTLPRCDSKFHAIVRTDYVLSNRAWHQISCQHEVKHKRDRLPLTCQ